MAGITHTYSTYIHSSPERLWEALTTPDLTRRYFDFMEGFMAVESEWAQGSPVVYRTQDGEVQIEGQVLEVQPSTRLVTSFSLRYDPEVRRDRPSRVTWEITRVDEDCRLSLTHDDPDGDTRTVRDMAVCMPSILGNLKALLETGRPRLVKSLVVDCQSPAAVAKFWAAVTGYVMQGPPPLPTMTSWAWQTRAGKARSSGSSACPKRRQLRTASTSTCMSRMWARRPGGWKRWAPAGRPATRRRMTGP